MSFPAFLVFYIVIIPTLDKRFQNFYKNCYHGWPYSTITVAQRPRAIGFPSQFCLGGLARVSKKAPSVTPRLNQPFNYLFI